MSGWVFRAPGVAEVGVRLRGPYWLYCKWTILAVIDWCFLPYALLARVVTPGCQIGYMDHTGCHHLVFWLASMVYITKNNLSGKVPTLFPGCVQGAAGRVQAVRRDDSVPGAADPDDGGDDVHLPGGRVGGAQRAEDQRGGPAPAGAVSGAEVGAVQVDP
jgi:hypothetical protein